MDKGKSNKLIAVIIIIIGIMLFSILFIYVYILDLQNEKYFKPNKSTQARILYDEVMSVDFEKEYPSDEEVILLNNKILMLVYGDMLATDDKLGEIIEVQRKMFSDQLLDLNTFDEQHKNVKKDVLELEKEDIYTIAMESGSMKYFYDDNEKATAKVTQFMSNGGIVAWEYYLLNEGGQWKINSWISKK